MRRFLVVHCLLEWLVVPLVALRPAGHLSPSSPPRIPRRSCATSSTSSCACSSCGSARRSCSADWQQTSCGSSSKRWGGLGTAGVHRLGWKLGEGLKRRRGLGKCGSNSSKRCTLDPSSDLRGLVLGGFVRSAGVHPAADGGGVQELCGVGGAAQAGGGAAAEAEPQGPGARGKGGGTPPVSWPCVQGSG
jgi:hypothetical protein